MNAAAPEARVIDAAVTDDPRAAPIEYVPDPYVTTDHRLMYVTGIVPRVENVCEFDDAAEPADAVAIVNDCRAYEPEFAFSDAPVVPGVAVFNPM